MELHDLIKKYRDVSFLTQSMFAKEICNNTNGKIKPTIGVINGIERGGTITDERLYNYLHKEFLFVDPDKSKKIVTLSYKIADFCVKNKKELDITHLFSCITLCDISKYLNSVIGDDITVVDNDADTIFVLMSDVVDVMYNQSSVKSYVINDTAIFVYNLCLWYFLLSNDREFIITKEEYSSDDFARFATAFGFEEFPNTSEKAKGKIAKAIGRRLSICDHYYDLIARVGLETYYDNDIIKYYTASLQNIADDDFFEETTIKKDVFNDIMSLVQSSADVEYDEGKALALLNNIYRTKTLLFNLYSFFQGRFDVPSLKYIQNICEKFEANNIFSINPNLHNVVETFKNKFHHIICNIEKGCSNPEILFELVAIQRTLFDIYKYNYIIKSKIDELNNVDSED